MRKPPLGASVTDQLLVMKPSNILTFPGALNEEVAGARGMAAESASNRKGFLVADPAFDESARPNLDRIF